MTPIPPNYTPDNQNSRSEDLRRKLMAAFTRDSVFNEPHSTVCAGIEGSLKQEGDSKAQEYMRKIISDGVANLRECVRSYWELKDMFVPESIQNTGGAALEYFSTRINTEIQRLMTMVVGAFDGPMLVPFEENQAIYHKTEESVNAIHDKLSNDIAAVTEEFKKLTGK